VADDRGETRAVEEIEIRPLISSHPANSFPVLPFDTLLRPLCGVSTFPSKGSFSDQEKSQRPLI
jgi:hypothetical protein